MSLEPARIGECDTPMCEGDAQTITPGGYVCETCAAEIAVSNEQTHDRETGRDRDE